MVSHGYRATIRQGWDGEEHVIHSERTDKFRLMMCQVTKDVTAYDSLEIQITPDQPQYANFHQFTTFVKVTRPDLHKIIFEGRVITPDDEMDTSGAILNDVICEGLEGFLHDSVQPFAEFHNTTPKNFIQAIITNHNNQVDAYKQIKLGNVTVTNSTDNVYRFLEDDKDTYDNITDKLVSRLGGEIRVRHELNGLYLDYEPQIGGKSVQKIELGKNLLSLQRAIDASTFYTALKPLGATKEPQDSTNTTDVSYPRLTIGGDGLIRNNALIAKFGLIVKANDWDDVTTQADLKAKGQAMMNAQKNLKMQIQLTYVDLSYIKKDLDSFNNGDTVELVSKIQGIDLIERITGMVINCVNVASSTMTIGEDDMNQSSYEAMNLAQANAANKTLAKMINAQAKQLAEIKSNSNTQYEELVKKNAELQAAIKQLEENGKDNVDGAIIDVSEFQGNINWPQVVSSGLALSVIRVQSGSSHIDNTYTANIPNAISAGANYAVYAYFSALNASDAEVEATDFYNRANSVIGSGKRPRFWMIDAEKNSTTSGTLSEAVTAYMNKLNALGIPDSSIVIYVSNDLYSLINTSRTQIWIPSYGANDGTVANSRKPLYPYDLWQYTSVGRVNGISGNVDMSTEPSTRFKDSYLKK